MQANPAALDDNASATVALQPSVSVIIPAYNAATTLNRGLEGVFAQTYANVVEVIVVDDGSQDETVALLQEQYPAVKCLRQQQRGVSAARNRGAAEARGQYLAFLDADDVWHPDKLSRQIAALSQAPDTALLLTRALRVFPGGKKRLPEGSDLAPCLPLSLSLWLSRKRRDGLSIYACVSSWVMPREVFVATGGFDEAWTISGDHEYILRLLGQGRPVAVLTEPLFDYYLSAGSLSHRPDCARYLAASQRVIAAWAAVPLPPGSDLTETQRQARVRGERRFRARTLLRQGCLGAALQLLNEGAAAAVQPATRLTMALEALPLRLAVAVGGEDWSSLGRTYGRLQHLRWILRSHQARR